MPEQPRTPQDEEIDRPKRRIDSIRPLSPKGLENLADWYDFELTYSSNAIEGNTLTLQETTLVIREGITIGGKKLADHLEAQDHYEAVKRMRAIAAEGRRVGEADVLALHEIITSRSKPHIAGTYATHPRRIQGSRVILPGPHKIRGLMEAFGKRLEVSDGPEAAFDAHYDLVTIHPFADGNGRTARLLMNLILVRDGYTPVAIGPPERDRYLKALETRQLAEPLGHKLVDAAARDGYRSFMNERLIASLQDHIDALEPEQGGQCEPPRPKGATPIPPDDGSRPAGSLADSKLSRSERGLPKVENRSDPDRPVDAEPEAPIDDRAKAKLRIESRTAR